MFDLFVSDILRFSHLLAVAIGFGVAVETEIFLVRRRRTAISPGLVSGLAHRHRVILGALGAMWVTGLALVALRTGFDPGAFSPKLWAKLTVVAILSVNALFVAEVAMPILADYRGRPIASLPAPKRRALFSVAGVSAASWLVALALGASAILKVAPAPVFQLGLPLAYVAGILGANLVGARLFAAPARQRPAPRPAPAAEAPRKKAPAPKRSVVLPAPAAEPRASDLAIAFPPKSRHGPRLKPGPDGEPASLASGRLARVATDLGTGR